MRKQKNLKIAGYVRSQPVIRDPDRVCEICNKEYKAVSPLQKTCSEKCRKIKNKKRISDFHLANPGRGKIYHQNALNKDPDMWRKKTSRERLEIVNFLGCQCIVENCSVKNPLHLHVDYIPTMIGTGYRHPRHKRWVLDNIKDFRLLCANHHYELSITGKIEGSQITQKTNRNND